MAASTFDTIVDPNAATARAKLAALQQERQQLEQDDQSSRAIVAAATASAATANGEHARLLRLCLGLEATSSNTDRPHERLGRAIVAAAKAQDELKAAEAEATAAASRRLERSETIDREIGTLEHALLKGRLHALVAEYERRVVVGELGPLSDAIRRAASAINMRVEPDAPLMTQGRLVVCGYPLRPWR